MTKKKQKVNPKKKQKKGTKTKVKPILNSQQAWIGLAVVLLIGALALGPFMQGDFLNYDDDIYVTGNPYIQNLDGNAFRALFSEYFANQYAPVAMIIMAIEAKMVGMDAYNLKIFSLLFHLLNTLLVFRLMVLLFKKNHMALIVAALFCWHPMQLESIAWLSASMKIESFSFFFLSSLICYTLYIDKKGPIPYYLASLALFVLACFSKEQAVSLAVTLFAIDYLRGRPLLEAKLLVEKLPFLAIAVVFGLFTIWASSEIEQNQNVLQFGILDRLLFVSYSLVAYLVKIALPFKLSFLYFFPMKGAMPITYYLSLLAILPLAYALYYTLAKGHKEIAFGILFFGINIGLAVVSQAFAVRDVIMADRYVYLPIIGFAILLAYGVDWAINNRKKNQNLIWGFLGAYALMLLVLTYQRTAIWKDSITVFTDAIEKSSSKDTPFLSLAYLNRGLGRKTSGDTAGAFADYNKAIALNAADHKSLLNRGNIYFNDNKWELAIQDYNAAEALTKTNAKIYSSRGAAYAGTKRYDLALQDLTKALELDPDFGDACKNRMLVYYFQNRFQEALQDCNRYLNLNPNDGAMIKQRGLIYQRLNRSTEAEADFARARQLGVN